MNIFEQCLNHESKKNKIINCISFFTIFAAFGLLVTFFYWLLFPYKPLVVNKNPSVYPSEVRAGDILFLELDYCKNMDLPVTIRRRFIDGLVYSLPEITTAENKTGCRVQKILLDAPEKLPEGEYRLDTDFVYKVNPIREVTVHAESEKFTVIGGDDSE